MRRVALKFISEYRERASAAEKMAPKRAQMMDADGELVDATPEAISARLTKSHPSRTAALLKPGCPSSDHIKREAARAGIDPNLLLAAVLGFLNHLLAPGKQSCLATLFPLP